jgi:hypothetical protein
VEATHIDAMAVETGAVVLRAYGPDWSSFPTGRQIVARATWALHVPKRGGQPVSKKSGARAWPRAPCATAKRPWERTIAGSATHRRRYGGVRHRRSMATLIYRLLRWGQPYLEQGAEAYENR